MAEKRFLDAIMLIQQNLKYPNNENTPPFTIIFFSFSVTD
jgi:hypothetical protein